MGLKMVKHKTVNAARRIARDDAHGYDNREGHRTGNPDYACSSFVAACYRKAGIPVPANSYTAMMLRTWKPYGFKNVSGKVDLRNGKGIKAGDVVIAPGKHTAICVNSFTHRLAEAVGNPRGSAANDKQGDQGREIRIRSWYDDGWSICLRYAGE